MDFIQLCRKVISFDTSPSHGTLDLCKFLQSYCAEKGVIAEIDETVHLGVPQANIIVRTTAEKPPVELMLLTHLDTNEPGPSLHWKQNENNPFNAQVIDEHIYGLGSANVKLDFLCKLESLLSLQSSEPQWKLPPVLVGTFGEELGMAGTLRLIRKAMVKPRYALIGDPTNLVLSHAGQGLARFEIEFFFSEEEKILRKTHNDAEVTSSQSRIFSGKPGISTEIDPNENAIKKLFEHLEKLPTNVALMEVDGGIDFNSVASQAFLEVDIVNPFSNSMIEKLQTMFTLSKKMEKLFLSHKDERFQPHTAQLNFGKVRTSEEGILIEGCCRIPPGVPIEIANSWIESFQSQLSVTGGSFKVVDFKKPYLSDSESFFARGLKAVMTECNLSTDFVSQATINEASLWSRVGVECFAFGAGVRKDNVHTPKENVSIKDLEQSIKVYRKILERFCA